MRSQTVYTVTEVNEAHEPDAQVVLATVVFDEALDSAREFPLIFPAAAEGEDLTEAAVHHRFIDVWRDGDIAHTLFFGENGLETAQKAIVGEMAEV